MLPLRFLRIIFIVIVIILPLFVPAGLVPPVAAEKAPKDLTWTWRKSFKNARLSNLSTAWNGSLLLFTVSESSPQAPASDVIVALDFDGRPLKDWRAPGKIRKITLDGSGQQLYVELENGDLLYYDQWMSKKPPRTISKKVKRTVLSPQADILLAELAGKSGKDEVRTISNRSSSLWSLNDIGPGEWSAIFPFAKQNNNVFAVSSTGKLKYFDQGKTLWSADLPGARFSLSSSFLQGSLLAAASGGDKGEVRFYDEKGSLLSKREFPTDTTTISCTDSGEACAVLGVKQYDRTLLFLTPQGKELWKEQFSSAGNTVRTVIAADHGREILAAVSKDGKDSLRAWNEKGELLWNAPVEGGIADFRSSWNGKYIALLTRDGRVVHFNLVPKKHEARKRPHGKTQQAPEKEK